MTVNLPVSMIFVCGPGHSGTSLLTAMLGAHPLVYSINIETRVFMKQGRKFIPEDDVYRTLISHVHHAKTKNAQFMCEKTPMHVMAIDLIRRLFPAARIVTIVRDARDACASLKARKGELEWGVGYWIRSAAALRAAVMNPAHDIAMIRYEDLVVDAERALRTVCEYIGIAYDERMLRYHDDDRTWYRAGKLGESSTATAAHNALRNWQIHQPLMDNRGKWKDLLSEREVHEIETRCGELMRFFGYAAAGAGDAAKSDGRSGSQPSAGDLA